MAPPAKKTAIITGGTSGIGLGIAKMCLSHGIPVFIISHGQASQTNLKLQSALSNTETPWTYFQADIQTWAEMESGFRQAMAWSEELGGKLWFVFANAGIGERKWVALPQEVPKGNERSFQMPNYEVIDVNVKGTLNTVALAVQAMRVDPDTIDEEDVKLPPRMVVISSICGFYALPGLPTYTAAKHALVGFTRSYAPQTLADYGITLHAICPNVVETNISTQAFYSSVKDIDPKLLTSVEAVIGVASSIVQTEGSLDTIYEVGPKGASIRDEDFVGYMDKETVGICNILTNRGLNLYGSSVPRR